MASTGKSKPNSADAQLIPEDGVNAIRTELFVYVSGIRACTTLESLLENTKLGHWGSHMRLHAVGYVSRKENEVRSRTRYNSMPTEWQRGPVSERKVSHGHVARKGVRSFGLPRRSRPPFAVLYFGLLSRCANSRKVEDLLLCRS